MSIIYVTSSFFSHFNKPVHQNDLPRPAGIASFMRLPISSLNVTRAHISWWDVDNFMILQETDKLDACIVGVPVDTATSNRPGTRFGPREIRSVSGKQDIVNRTPWWAHHQDWVSDGQAEEQCDRRKSIWEDSGNTIDNFYWTWPLLCQWEVSVFKY